MDVPIQVLLIHSPDSWDIDKPVTCSCGWSAYTGMAFPFHLEVETIKYEQTGKLILMSGIN